MNEIYELYHYGVKGMKWGVRKNPYSKRYIRGHAGGGRWLTKKRQLAGDKRDLKELEEGQHLSVGLTKKRQAKFDARDKAALEKRIAKNEAQMEQKANRKARADKMKKEISNHLDGEVAKRGKAALDVLMNGDTDWMGNSLSSDNMTKEVRNRGRAAVERLLYSEEQIDNKKFFGRYNF